VPRNTSGLKRGGPGRPKGVPNKANATLKAAAQAFTEESLQVLVDIMRLSSASEQARISAAREILDRGHGKSPQAVTDADGGNLHIPGSVAFIIQQQLGAENRP